MVDYRFFISLSNSLINISPPIQFGNTSDDRAVNRTLCKSDCRDRESFCRQLISGNAKVSATICWRWCILTAFNKGRTNSTKNNTKQTVLQQCSVKPRTIHMNSYLSLFTGFFQLGCSILVFYGDISAQTLTSFHVVSTRTYLMS